MNLSVKTIYFGSANRAFNFEWVFELFRRGFWIGFEGIRYIVIDVVWWEVFYDEGLLRWFCFVW
jgi:hypothetical protein